MVALTMDLFEVSWFYYQWREESCISYPITTLLILVFKKSLNMCRLWLFVWLSRAALSGIVALATLSYRALEMCVVNLVCCKYKVHIRYWRLITEKDVNIVNNSLMLITCWHYNLVYIVLREMLLKLISHLSFYFLKIWLLAHFKLYISCIIISIGQCSPSRFKTRDDLYGSSGTFA